VQEQYGGNDHRKKGDGADPDPGRRDPCNFLEKKKRVREEKIFAFSWKPVRRTANLNKEDDPATEKNGRRRGGVPVRER